MTNSHFLDPSLSDETVYRLSVYRWIGSVYQYHTDLEPIPNLKSIFEKNIFFCFKNLPKNYPILYTEFIPISIWIRVGYFNQYLINFNTDLSTDAKNLTFLIFLAWHFASPTCARMEKGTLNEKRERERGEAFVVCSKTLNTARDHTIILCGPEPNFVFKNLPKTSLSRNSKFLRTNKILKNFDKKLFFLHIFFLQK